MKCPHCGALMKDEQVFCESCGEERQLVPVFDAEIEAKLASTISGIADDLANTQEIKPLTLYSESETKETEEEQLNKEEQEETEPQKEPEEASGKTVFSHPLVWVIAGILAVVFCVLIVVFIVYHNNVSSYEYQLKKAEEMYQLEDYDQMLSYAQEAIALAPNSSDAKMMIARAYGGSGQKDMEQQMLEELLESDSAYAPAYDLLIPLYEGEGDYAQIGTLLSLCKEQTVLDKYVDYRSDMPQFSYEGGLYEEVLSLKLLAAGGGDIFYTIDGSEPDEGSLRYITPIILDSGAYCIKAIYVNPCHVVSEVAEKCYFIDAYSMDAPYVNLESGTYTEPQMITVDIPDDSYQVYYTMDGTDPSYESILYTQPIPLPLGESRFAFIMYDEKDEPSNIAYMQYSLTMELTLSADQAKNLLVQALIIDGYLLDADGSVEGMEGSRQFESVSVISENDGLYYLLDEVFLSADGVAQKTGESFAVSITTGESFRVTENAAGGFDMHKI